MADKRKDLLYIGRLLREYNEKYGFYHTSVFVINGNINAMAHAKDEQNDCSVDIFEPRKDSENDVH